VPNSTNKDDQNKDVYRVGKTKLDGCIVWNAHNTVLGSKQLAICVTV